MVQLCRPIRNPLCGQEWILVHDCFGTHSHRHQNLLQIIGGSLEFEQRFLDGLVSPVEMTPS